MSPHPLLTFFPLLQPRPFPRPLHPLPSITPLSSSSSFPAPSPLLWLFVPASHLHVVISPPFYPSLLPTPPTLLYFHPPSHSSTPSPLGALSSPTCRPYHLPLPHCKSSLELIITLFPPLPFPLLSPYLPLTLLLPVYSPLHLPLLLFYLLLPSSSIKHCGSLGTTVTWSKLAQWDTMAPLETVVSWGTVTPGR